MKASTTTTTKNAKYFIYLFIKLIKKKKYNKKFIQIFLIYLFKKKPLISELLYDNVYIYIYLYVIEFYLS